MVLSSFVALLVQCAGMAIGTFLCGIVPLYLSLSKTKLRVLEVMGTGLLVGASMTVVLPEGVNALFSVSSTSPTHSHGAPDGTHNSHWDRRAGTTREHRYDPESAVGMALLSGFLIMFFIDQIASPGAHVHASPTAAHDHEVGPSVAANSNHWHGPSHRTEAMRLTRASSLAIGKSDDENGKNGKASQHATFPSSESSPEQLPADHDFVTHLQDPILRQNSSTASFPTPSTSHPRRASDAASRASSTVRQRRSIRHAFASIIGLIIHAAADGIAMGASAGSGDESLKLVVLFAIMIHKAPASFGLCTLLMGQRLHKSDVRKAIGIFCLATPIGAITTYLLLAVILKSESPDSNGLNPQHIGAALTFSAGTFLFVAMHAVQELASAAADIDTDELRQHHQHHGHVSHAQSRSQSHDQAVSHANLSAPPKQILGRTGRVAVFVSGTILPKVLQTLVGHPH